MPRREVRLRRLVRERLRKAGFAGSDSLVVPMEKEAFRRVHRLARRHEVSVRRGRIREAWQRQKENFADGGPIDPASISPKLEFIRPDDDDRNELFRVARLYWSLPYSQGYGRRIRVLIWDKNSQHLMGIVGLQSPPLDFKARDNVLSYGRGTKTYFVNQMMDAYTVGGVPPYNFVLGGKLAAMVLGCNEVREEYRRRYRETRTRMERRIIPPRLIAVTTTSAYGKSSLYDRVRDPKGEILLRSLGVIEDTHGSYHFNGLYPLLRDFVVRKQKQRRVHGYGVGPRIRWQIIREGLRDIGLSPNLLQHRVPREVYLVSNLRNLQEYVGGAHKRPLWEDRPFRTLSAFWRDRWLVPRWERLQADPHKVREFREWRRLSIIQNILNA